MVKGLKFSQPIVLPSSLDAIWFYRDDEMPSKASGTLTSLDPDHCAIGPAPVWTKYVIQQSHGDTAAGRRLWYVDVRPCPVDDLSGQCFVSTSPLNEKPERCRFVLPMYLFSKGYIVVTCLESAVVSSRRALSIVNAMGLLSLATSTGQTAILLFLPSGQPALRGFLKRAAAS